MAARHRSVVDTAFKAVADRPGYWVGTSGTVLSDQGGRLSVLKPTPRKKSGHMVVCLGRRCARLVHRLVLEAFVGPCPEGMECRHLDGNPANNRLDNLCWGTRRENCEDAVRHGTAFMFPGQESMRGEANLAAKLTESVVREIMAVRTKTGAGPVGIARAVGLPDAMRGAVEGVIRGASWNHVTGLPKYAPRTNRREAS